MSMLALRCMFVECETQRGVLSVLLERDILQHIVLDGRERNIVRVVRRDYKRCGTDGKVERERVEKDGVKSPPLLRM